MRLRLDLGYDGGGFHGWAAQTGLRTVQGELELWIQRVLRLAERPELVVAGRTDAGVHARPPRWSGCEHFRSAVRACSA